MVNAFRIAFRIHRGIDSARVSNRNRFATPLAAPREATWFGIRLGTIAQMEDDQTMDTNYNFDV